MLGDQFYGRFMTVRWAQLMLKGFKPVGPQSTCVGGPFMKGNYQIPKKCPDESLSSASSIEDEKDLNLFNDSIEQPFQLLIASIY